MNATAPVVDDTDVVDDLEKLLADDVPCDRDECERPATWHVTCASRCGNEALLCSEHYKGVRDAHPPKTLIRCPVCGRTGVFSLLFKSRML